jgi:hypothetical protein
MSDCLKNEDTLVSDLVSSNVDSLTGTLDSGDSIGSEMSVYDTMASSIADGDSTTSNLSDVEPLTSELGVGGGGGTKYAGQETDNIVVTVDNNVNTISANLKQIKFNSVSDFPPVGSDKLIYVDFSNKTLYGWDSGKGVYYKLVADVKIPTKLSEFENDAGFVSEESAKRYTDTRISELIDSAPETLDTFKEIADAFAEDQEVLDALNGAIGNKVDKIQGKGLSSNDFTTEEKNKLSTVEEYAQQNTVHSVNGKTGYVQLTADDFNALPDTTTFVSDVFRDYPNQNIIGVKKRKSDGTYSSSMLFTIIDDLNTESSTNVLSAKQGKVLYDMIQNAGSGGTKIIWRKW